MTTVAGTQNWKEEFIKRLVEEGELQRGQLASIMREFSEKHGIEVKSLSNFYYRTGKELVEQELSKKQGIKHEDISKQERKDISTELSESERKLVDSLKTVGTRPLKPPYKVGEIVDVEITALVGFGAFCKILDAYEYPALIHIKHITGLYVSDVEEYFKVGDRLKAKVYEIKDDKISLSTKGMPLPSQLPKEYRTEFTPTQPTEPFKNTTLAEKLANLTLTEVAAAQKPEEPIKLPNADPEMDEIIKFLNTIVGMVSPKAQNMAKEIIEEHGLFRFTLAMARVAQTFENDLGVHLMKEIKKSVGDCL